MGTLTISFAIAWSAVAAYAGWLGLQQRRLQARLNQLEDQVASADEPVSRAA